MKKIILIGDSIRMGYDRDVRDRLKDVAEVYFPNENCRFAQYVLRHAILWKENEKWPDDVDLIHWNAGLWDTCRVLGDEPLTPLPVYRDFVVRIHRNLRILFPNARIAFATSTPVHEAGYAIEHGNRAQRYNRDIEAYNAAAVEALTSLGESIDDLYSVMAKAPLSEHSDCTHFYTPLGTARIVEAVTRFLCTELDIPVPAAKSSIVGASSSDIGL